MEMVSLKRLLKSNEIKWMVLIQQNWYPVEEEIKTTDIQAEETDSSK